jgi:hypothetical protein
MKQNGINKKTNERRFESSKAKLLQFLAGFASADPFAQHTPPPTNKRNESSFFHPRTPFCKVPHPHGIDNRFESSHETKIDLRMRNKLISEASRTPKDTKNGKEKSLHKPNR